MTEISTPKLIELLARPNGLRLHDLLLLQGETTIPTGDTAQITLTAVYPETGEFEISMPEKGYRRPGPLNLSILADAGWFPSPQLAELIRHVESAVTGLEHVDLAAVQARMEQDRDAAKRDRQSAAHSRLCSAALQAALGTLQTPGGQVVDWHLVLLAMAGRHAQVVLRNERDTNLFRDQVAAAREHGAGMRISPKQSVWQTDILRRSADGLRETPAQ